MSSSLELLDEKYHMRLSSPLDLKFRTIGILSCVHVSQYGDLDGVGSWLLRGGCPAYERFVQLLS